MAVAGRWQREYERDWQLSTRQTLTKRFGVRCVQCPPAVTPDDERQLREVLAAAGIAHVPPNHSRWQAPFPPSQTLTGTQDADMTDESYVYCTPPSPPSQSVFPAFDSQDLASQTTPQRRVSASQRLRLRLADVSPITEPTNSQDLVPETTPERRVSASQRMRLRMADVSPITGPRRASLDVAGRISPPSGAAKSPWTPGSGSKSRRRSVGRRCDGDDLDVSMQSMQLSDDEGGDTQMIDVSGVHGDAESAEVDKGAVETEDRQQGDAANKSETMEDKVAADLPAVNCQDEDEEVNVSKALVFSSDSEDDEVEECGDLNTTTRRVTAGAQTTGQLPREDLSERSPWGPEPEYEFGYEGNEGSEQHDEEQQDTEMPELIDPPVDNALREPDTELVYEVENSGVNLHQQGDLQDTELLELPSPDPGNLSRTPSRIGKERTPSSVVRSTRKRQSATSTRTTPARMTPNRTTPARMTPNRATPARMTPNRATLSRATPTRASQARSTPARPTPIRATPSRTRSTPTRASPTNSMPVRGIAAAPASSRKSNGETGPESERHSSSTSSTASSASKSSLSRKRANRGPLLHTKLPLQMEYRFASDRRRRRRRRKSLAAKPGVFPYVVPELLVELQPYQKEALHWMLEREQERCGPISIDQQRRGEATAVDALVAKICGGVLADEMGLGKTVCCLALICESLRQARAADAEARSKSGSTVPRLTPPTLIVTPLSILSQWEHEIRAKTNLSVVTYQGASRKTFRSAMEFMGADIVLSTYDTLRLLECKVLDKDSYDDVDQNTDAADSAGTPSRWHQAARLTPRSKRSVVTSKLHQLQWFRVILDESHLIANAGCARARAALTLNSRRRWCVTGTPIQNGTADLAALLQFIGLGNRAHTLSEVELGALVPRIVMRRLKSTVDATSRAPILELPEKVEKIVELEFGSDVERALYMLLHRSTKRQVLRYLRSKESKQARGAALRSLTTPTKDGGEPLFMHVFELILRLRQVCNACTLVTSDPLSEVLTRAASAEALAGSRRDGISPFSAGEAALLKRLQDQQEAGDVNAGNGCGHLESTKLAAVMNELIQVRARGERALVISQWTSFLDKVADRLDAHNVECETRASRLEQASERGSEAIAFAKIDGRMAARDREQVVRAFQQQEDSSSMERASGPPLDVLLLSLRTGGLGLNLTAASHVFIMEPSWNPSLERQAVDRAHRFGQQRKVRVVRFIVKGSIEERVVDLQNKKRQLTADFLGDGGHFSSAKKNRLRETRLSTGDLRRLFFTQQDEQRVDDGNDDENHKDDEDNEVTLHEDADQSDDSVTCIEISDK